MTHRVPTAIGGVTQIRDNKNTRRLHVSSPSQLPNSCGPLTFVIAGMGVFHVVVPHAEFVLQAATPRAFTIMIVTLAKFCMRRVQFDPSQMLHEASSIFHF